MFLRSISRSRWQISHHLAGTSTSTSTSTITRYASTSSNAPPPPRSPKPPVKFPTVPSCPSPTCTCAEMPEFPKGFEIDRDKPLNGTMASFAEQVLICTGKDDWESNITDENSGDNLAADIKELVGRGGMYSDPYHNIAVTNASFPPSVPARSEIQTTSAYLFPSFKYVPFLPRVSFDSVQALVKGFLLPKKLHPMHDALSPIHRDRLLRSEDQGRFLPGVRDVKDVLIMICGHGGRDLRCGVLGPLLQGEFESQLPTQGIQVLKGPIEVTDPLASNLLEDAEAAETKESRGGARVGLISHIGGHKFAGNVIIYIPPGFKSLDGKESPLAGTGIWYGRVEPKHIEGIVKETILGGKVIEDLFRGGIKQGGEILRL